MIRKPFYLLASAAILSVPVSAAAPPFETAASVAYMIDLSSGAVLYAKDADRRIPPASMAKMMTVYVAFDLIKKGELKLDRQIEVRPSSGQPFEVPNWLFERPIRLAASFIRWTNASSVPAIPSASVARSRAVT